MPIYEYACRSCGREFEKLVYGQRAAVVALACPTCQSVDVARRLSLFGMKGSTGFAGSVGGGCGCGRGGCGCH